MNPAKSGHSLERFQERVTLRPNNVVPGTGVDLKSAGGTAIGNFVIPDVWGTVTVLAIGLEYVAAGGAQTTAGAAKLQIAGADVNNAAGSPFTVASVASHTLYDTEETELNSTTAANQYSAAPSYPTLTAGQACQMIVATQGAGAGPQTVYPYLVIRQKPPTT